ncbi:hypothetical protein HPC37_06175 [Pasteurellaceae bacterium 20609_3]|uniref:hypothetical protein n=1 Tax=Spirabiliibacterium mucosae TaxID=28156 RepID=UPI001AAC8FBD|nr:hypothetical protein [Spirabiliibacterium mucosae]MBE2898402.1 hypothetical protein [Spirabiliibacterium mucosae]
MNIQAKNINVNAVNHYFYYWQDSFDVFVELSHSATTDVERQHWQHQAALAQRNLAALECLVSQAIATLH